MEDNYQQISCMHAYFTPQFMSCNYHVITCMCVCVCVHMFVCNCMHAEWGGGGDQGPPPPKLDVPPENQQSLKVQIFAHESHQMK